MFHCVECLMVRSGCQSKALSIILTILKDMQMAPKWVVCSTAVTFGRDSSEPVDRFEVAGCEVRFNPYGRPLDKKRMLEFARYDDAIILGNDDLPTSVIRCKKRLKIIVRYGVGFDGVDVAEARETLASKLPTRLHRTGKRSLTSHSDSFSTWNAIYPRWL
jgi:hypothetical protein